MLEHRLVPAGFIWTNGTSDGLVSTAANWTHAQGGASAVPGSGDYAYFGFGGSGSNTPATVDLANWSVDRIEMDANYTSTLSIPAGNQVATNNYFQQYGTLDLTGDAVVEAGTYFAIYGDVVANESGTLTAEMNTTGSFFLNTGGTITVLGGDNTTPDLEINSGGFQAGGTINVGKILGNSGGVDFGVGGDLVIVGYFSQVTGQEINVYSDGNRSTLTFEGGSGGQDTILQGDLNLVNLSYTFSGAIVSSDTMLAIHGGRVNANTMYTTQALVGEVSVYNGGEINVGIYAELVISTGSLIVGAPDKNSGSTGGEINLDLYGTLSFPSASGTTEFVLMSISEINMNGGSVIAMDTSRVAALEIPEAETSLTPGTINSLYFDNTIYGNVENNGIIEFGGQLLHTLYITGNYTQGEEGVLSMRMKDTAGSGQPNDKIIAGGTATLDGGLLLTAMDTLFGGTPWDLITTGSGVSGSFASITWPDSDPGWFTAFAAGITIFQVDK